MQGRSNIVPLRDASPLRKQFLFLRSRHLFDGAFSFHGGVSIRLFFHIHQFHRQTHFGVFRAAPFVMGGDTALGVCRPTRVIRAIGTFNDIAITDSHLFFLQTIFQLARKHLTEALSERGRGR